MTDFETAFCVAGSLKESLDAATKKGSTLRTLMDEPRETVSIELFESETEKLDAMSLANKLNRAQMIAKLIDDYSVAKPYVNHGDHGPEPLFDGDAWTVWHCCGNCDHPISYGDSFCRTCGARIDWGGDA